MPLVTQPTSIPIQSLNMTPPVASRSRGSHSGNGNGTKVANLADQPVAKRGRIPIDDLIEKKMGLNPGDANIDDLPTVKETLPDAGKSKDLAISETVMDETLNKHVGDDISKISHDQKPSCFRKSKSDITTQPFHSGSDFISASKAGCPPDHPGYQSLTPLTPPVVVTALQQAKPTYKRGKPIADPDSLWNVAEIIDRRIIRGKVLYRVKWVPTWEFQSALAEMQDRIDCFESKLLQNTPEGVSASLGSWQCRITGRRRIGERIQYRLVWEPTWEPELELSEVEELIDNFLANQEPKKRSKAVADDLDEWRTGQSRKRRR